VVPDFNPWANSEKNQLFYLLPSLSSLIHQHSPPPKLWTPLLLSLSLLFSPMEIWSFNQGKGSRLEAKGSSKAPSLLSPSSSLDSSRVLLYKGI
jgi:hypothetical protein